MITTITPYWNREPALLLWLLAVQRATCERVHHIVFFVGEHVPPWVTEKFSHPNFEYVAYPQDLPGSRSIGYYHNLGARRATTEWIMKLDVDALSNVAYFKSLVEVLGTARPREWFNGGMFYLSTQVSSYLTPSAVIDTKYYTLMRQQCPTLGGSNFICRREEYLALGGCHPGFEGWGWEDYQQLYMLESYQRQACPLPGIVSLRNVTQRCRDEISRPKARELQSRCEWLGLLHRWHNPSGKDRSRSEANRRLLLDYILSRRKETP